MSDWNNNNNSTMVSDHSTSDGSKCKDSEGYSWNNYDGVKGSRNSQVSQMNSKDYDGEHKFYNPNTGIQGVAGKNRD